MTSRSLTRDPALDAYVVANGARESPLQQRLRAETATMPGAGMQIGPDQARMMAFLAATIGARTALEIGTYTGYSALAVAAVLPQDGRLIACDVSAEWTAVAQRYWTEAGLGARIELRLGPALDTLASLLREGRADGFDFAFIDADKEHYDGYYEACLRLVRRGGLILLDNVLWSGRVADPSDQTVDTRALRALNEKIRDDARVDLCMLTVGDGVSVVRRR